MAHVGSGSWLVVFSYLTALTLLASSTADRPNQSSVPHPDAHVRHAAAAGPDSSAMWVAPAVEPILTQNGRLDKTAPYLFPLYGPTVWSAPERPWRAASGPFFLVQNLRNSLIVGSTLYETHRSDRVWQGKAELVAWIAGVAKLHHFAVRIAVWFAVLHLRWVAMAPLNTIYCSFDFFVIRHKHLVYFETCLGLLSNGSVCLSLHFFQLINIHIVCR